MKESIKTLASSKRALVALLGILSVVLTHFLTHHIGLDPAEAQELSASLTSSILGLAGVLIASIGISDHGKAMGKPSGVGHKEDSNE